MNEHLISDTSDFADAPYTLEISCLPAVNFALQQNRRPLIHSIRIKSRATADLCDAAVVISASPAFFREYRRPVSVIGAGSVFELREPDLTMDAVFLSGLTEKITGSVAVKLEAEGRILCAETAEITVLAFNEWHGSQICPEVLAAFAVPNHPCLNAVNLRAAGYLEEWTGDPSLDGYQSKDTNRVLLQAAAVYRSLQAENIVYAEPPASFESAGQRVRLADEVLEQKMGTCLDLSLLYAGCLEAIGLHPLLVMLPGHIFAGVWLEDSTFSEPVQDDESLLTKRIAEGTRVIALVECTLFATGRNAGFDEACRAAENKLTAGGGMLYFIDVRRARLSRIVPLPQLVESAGGRQVLRPAVDEAALTDAPEEIAAPIGPQTSQNQPFSRKVLWERKLLDLGMRNALLNLRLTRQTVPLLTSSPDDLEDALADGGDFSIRPRPSEWSVPGGQIGFENLRAVEGYEELLQSEFRSGRLRSALTEGELSAALKNLYRSARADMEENGANTLYISLGLLKWYETDRSAQPRYAPLLLLPVEMVRKSAAEGYVIRLRDDDAQMNVTLLEKLRQDFGVDIGGLDPLPTDGRGIDTRMVFAAVRRGIMEQKRWDVLETAALGIFSFSQFVMWNDIRNRTADLARSKVVRSLLTNTLAWQAEEMRIEGDVPEDGVLLPLPADASQLFAIEEAAAGKTFVLHGPPGTGKSQTITALIANTLARGKTVLFVAEKMAALEVVQKRLEKIGIAPFCLELHSNKARKRDVLEQLRQASEVTKYTSSGKYQASADRIAALRKQLNRYKEALHRQQPSGKTIYELINLFQSCENAPELPGFSRSFFGAVTEEGLAELEALMDRLVTAGRAVGHPAGHPLGAVGATAYSQQLRRMAGEYSAACLEALKRLAAAADAYCRKIGVGASGSFDELGRMAQAADWLCSVAAFPGSWVTAEDPETLLGRIAELAAHRQRENGLRLNLTERWHETFLSQNGTALSAGYRQNMEKWFGARLIAMKRFRGAMAAFAKVPVTDELLGRDLPLLVSYREEKRAAETLSSQIGGALAVPDRGVSAREDTDWAQAAKLAETARTVLRLSASVQNGEALRRQFGADREAAGLARAFSAAWKQLLGARQSLYSLLDIRTDGASAGIVSEAELCRRIGDNTGGLRDWVLWNNAAAEARGAGLGPAVDAYEGGMAHDDLIPAFRKTVYRGLAAEAIDGEEALNAFTGSDFNGKIAQFGRLDAELTELARGEIFCRLAAQVPNFTAMSVSSSETGILQKAIKSGGRGVSIRRLFEQIPNLLPKLCPCMLMSPISVAQYLDPNRKPFDLIVFDEASQLPTSKAIGALARGENAVIVGDPKQMPPTSFFASSVSDEEHLDEEDMESILDDCLALNMPQTHLLWHYRSRHESLISFSNRTFYENKLYTFPSVNDRESRVRLVHVDGVFEHGGRRINRAEAEAVVAELTRRCHDPALSGMSVGVVTFNISQQNLIDDLLSEACRADPQLDEWVYRSDDPSAEPVFIKNLENVQGDERDVILFSVGYGPDASGKVSMNFGPLNRDGGWRRLNVAVSRARCEMIVFATLRPDQIDPARTGAEGVLALKAFMEFAASGTIPETEITARGRTEGTGGIADSICAFLREHGYETDCAVGKSAYKIDIGVVDPSAPDRYLLGILLDGDGYRTAQTARDRELAQISVLGNLGWTLTRVWSMDWWEDSGRELNRILSEVRSAQSLAERLAEEEEKRRTEEEIRQRAEESAAETDTEGDAADDLPAQIPEDGEEEQASADPMPLRSAEREDKPPFEGLVPERAVREEAQVYRITPLKPASLGADEFTNPFSPHRNDIVNRIKRVVDWEAPVSEGLLTRRVTQSCGVSRVGPRMQQYLSVLYASLRLPYTEQNGQKFYWSGRVDPLSWRGFRTAGEGEARRDPKDIPAEEAVNALCAVLEEQFSLPEEDLIRGAAKKMGFGRMTAAVNALFSDAAARAEREGRIRRSDNGNLMIKE